MNFLGFANGTSRQMKIFVSSGLAVFLLAGFAVGLYFGTFDFETKPYINVVAAEN